MKAFFSTVILWTCILISGIPAQSIDIAEYTYYKNTRNNDITDTLHVIKQDILYVQVATPKIHDLKHSNKIPRLLIAFREQFKTIQSQIPEYLIYKITYVKNINLTVEEVQGIVKYYVEDGESKFAENQNVAILIDGNLKIYLYFNEINDLFTQKYETMISNAFEKINRPNFFKRTYSLKDEYFYSYSKGKMVKGGGLKPSKPKSSFVINGSAGFFNNEPIYESGAGYGIFFGQRKRRFIYMYAGAVYQFDKELKNHEYDVIIGLGYKPFSNSKVSIAVPLSGSEGEPRVYDDVLFRLSGTYYPFKNVNVDVHLFFTEREGDFFYYPGVSIGFGI